MLAKRQSSRRRVNPGSAAPRPAERTPARTGVGSGSRGGIPNTEGTSPQAPGGEDRRPDKAAPSPAAHRPSPIPPAPHWASGGGRGREPGNGPAPSVHGPLFRI